MSQWRTRTFYLTRNRVFLAKVALGILGVFMLLAVAVHHLRTQSRHDASRDFEELLEELRDRAADDNDDNPEVAQALLKGLPDDEEYRMMLKAGSPDPARLLRWLQDLIRTWREAGDANEKPAFDATALKLGEVPLEGVLRKHTMAPSQYESFASYVRYWLTTDPAVRKPALQELEKLGQSTSAPRYANTLLAAILQQEHRPADQLRALMREGKHADAVQARRGAFELALLLKDEPALEEMCRDRAFVRDVEPNDLKEAAIILKDWWLRVRAVGAVLWERWMQSVLMPVALLTAAIWYVILVYTGSSERGRWVRYLPPVFAGVASVTLLLWAQESFDYKMPDEGGPAPTPTHAMVDWVLNVGLPEELVKMLCFAIFLPVLLHKGSPIKAALTGGCVGLGFSLDENLLYMAMDGSSAALERLLTANFLHIGLTGVVGWSLYELFRSKFNKAVEFLLAFAGAVCAHGLYNFSATLVKHDWGLEIMHIVIVAALAHFYLRLLHAPGERTAAGWVVSRTAIFTWGLALLVGLLMVVVTSATHSLTGISATLKSALSMAVLAYMYVRQFQEV